MLFTLGVIGALCTLYAIYVEKRHEDNANYNAYCDINNRVSCTAVLKSPYARMVKKTFNLSDNSVFNVPNTYYGMLFYIAVILYNVYPFTLIPFREVLLLGASFCSLLVCVMLGYIMHYKLHNYCLVCIATYIVNAFVFVGALTECGFL